MTRCNLLAILLCLALGTGLFMACGGGGGGSTANVLFVDDDSGMNNRGVDVTDFPDVDHVYTTDLDALGINYDVHRVIGHMTDGPSLSKMQQYEVVIWDTGESYIDGADPITLTLLDQAAIAAYLDGGGRLFLSAQDLLYDLGIEAGGDVLSAFANSYLGVMDATEDGADLPSTWGVTGDPISSGMVFSGVDADGDGYVDGFATEVTVGEESGSAVWDSTSDPQTLELTATSMSGFTETVFNSTFDIAVTDSTLSFNNQSFWANTDGIVSAEISWYEYLGINHYAELDLESGTTYTYTETDGIIYDAYPDTLNESNPFPASADTLLVDSAGVAVATRVEQSPWKVVFLALPYAGLGPASDRRTFLEQSIFWLQQ